MLRLFNIEINLKNNKGENLFFNFMRMYMNGIFYCHQKNSPEILHRIASILQYEDIDLSLSTSEGSIFDVLSYGHFPVQGNYEILQIILNARTSDYWKKHTDLFNPIINKFLGSLILSPIIAKILFAFLPVCNPEKLVLDKESFSHYLYNFVLSPESSKIIIETLVPLLIIQLCKDDVSIFAQKIQEDDRFQSCARKPKFKEPIKILFSSCLQFYIKKKSELNQTREYSYWHSRFFGYSIKAEIEAAQKVLFDLNSNTLKSPNMLLPPCQQGKLSVVIKALENLNVMKRYLASSNSLY